MKQLALFFGVFVAHTLVALPRNLVESTKSGTIINIIYVAIIAILISYLIYKLIKNFSGSDIIDISEYLGGKVFKTIIGIIFISYFSISSGILLRNFCECLKIVYYPMTSLVFIILAFIVTLYIVLKFNFSSISKVNLIIIPLVLISIVFLFVANLENFSISNMFPIFGDGLFDTFVTGLGNISAFAGIALLYFLPPYLQEPQKTKKVFLLSMFFGAIYLLLCVSIILFMLIFLMYTNEILPLYSAARYIEFGTFFQRLESIFLLIWILQVCCYLAIITKISISILKKVTNCKYEKPIILLFTLLIFAISFLPKNYAISKFIESSVNKYLSIGITIFLGLIILILANFKKSVKNKIERIS